MKKWIKEKDGSVYLSFPACFFKVFEGRVFESVFECFVIDYVIEFEEDS